MKCAIYGLLGFLVCAPALSAEYPKFTKEFVGSAIDLTELTLEWRDEFDSLRASRVGRGSGPWFVGIHAVLAPGEKMASLPNPAYQIESGVLKMATRLDPTDGKRFEAHLQTDDGKGAGYTFQNGYIEARMWLPKALGSHAGLWLLSKEEGAGHSEVDIVETYGTGDASVHSSTHIWPWPRPPEHQYSSKRTVKPDIFEGYHLYGLRATDTYFIFYYDREETARIPRLPEQKVPFYILLSVFGNPTQPKIEPATMLVDYVRVYSGRTPMPPILSE